MDNTKKLSDLKNERTSDFAKFRSRREKAQAAQPYESRASLEKSYAQAVNQNKKLNSMKNDTKSDYAKFIKRRNVAELDSNLQQKKNAQKEYLDSDENVGFFEAMLPGGATPTEYMESRKQKKQYKKEVEEAASQVAAYEQAWRTKEVQQKTSAEIDSFLSESDEKIEKLEDEKIGFFEAMKPGGVTPRERRSINAEKEAEIKKLESQQGVHRAFRDEKKSHEMTDGLPDDVKTLLDEYNNLIYGRDYHNVSSIAMGFAGMQGGANNLQQSADEYRIEQIKKELTDKGYDNWVELSEYRKYITDKQTAQKQEDNWSELAEEHPVVASAGARLTGVPASIWGLYGSLKQTENSVDFIGGTPYSAYYNPTRERQAADQTIAEGFEDGILSAEAKSFLYSSAASGADSMIASAMTAGFSGLGSGTVTGIAHALGIGTLSTGEVLLALGAANDTIVRSAERGLTQKQAMTTAAAAMASEILPELFSLGKLNIFKASGEVTTKAAITNLLKNSFVNMTEEMATEITNITFDYYYNGGLSDYYNAYENYIDMGLSESEAKQTAASDMAMQAVQAGASGALIGGVFSGVESVSNAVNYNSQLKDFGKQTVSEGKVDSVLAGAEDVKNNSRVSRLAEKITESEKMHSQNSELKYKNSEYKNIGKLISQIEKATVKDSEHLIKTAVRDRLTALGETGNIEVKASAIVKTLENSRLSKAEKTALSQGKYTQRLINEASDSSGKYSSNWAETLRNQLEGLKKRRYEPDVEQYRSRSKQAETQEKTKAEQSKPEATKAENAKQEYKKVLIQEGQSKEIFDKGFQLYYEQGYSGGYEFSEVKNNSNVSEEFTDFQRQESFNLGVRQGLRDKGNARYKGDTVNVFVSGYTGNGNVNSYTRAFDVFYASALNTDKSFGEVLKNEASLLKYIDKETAEKAFKQGESVKKSSQTEKRKKITKEKKQGEYKSKTVQEDEIDIFLEAVAKKLGVEVVREQRITNSKGREANAFFDPDKAQLKSSASSSNEYQSAIHEIVHYGYAYNSDGMQAVAEAVKDYYISKNGASEYETALKEYESSGYDESKRSVLEEEFTADGLAGMFSTDEGINEFLEWLQKESGYAEQEKTTVLKRLTDWLLEILDKIKELISDGQLNDVTREFAKSEAERFGEIRKLFLEALDEVEATEGNVEKLAKDANINYSLSDSLEKNGKILYNDDNPLAVVNRAKSNNNSSLKWVYDSEIFSVKENKLFHEKISEINQGSQAFSQNSVGEYMIPIENKIIFTDGNYDSPYVREIVEVLTEYQTRFEDIRERIYNVEKGRSDKYKTAQALAKVYGDGIVITYRAGISGVYGWEDGKRKGKTRRAVIANYLNKQVRAGNDFKSRETSINEIAPVQSTVSDNSKFSLKPPENPVTVETAEREKLSSAVAKLEKHNIAASHFYDDFFDYFNENQEIKNQEIRSLEKKNEELDKLNDELRMQIKHPGVKHRVSKLAVDEVSRTLKKEYLSTIDRRKLSSLLNDFYTLLANDSTASWDTVQIHLESIADKIINKSKYKNPDITDYAKEVLREIRSVKIKLNDAQKKEAASEYGSYNNFRKKTMGSLVISNEGVSLDQRWQELSKAYPNFFPNDTPDTDQPRLLAEAVAALRESYDDPYGMDEATAKDMLMTEIYEQYFKVPETKYISQEYALKLAGQRAYFDERLRAEKARLKNEREKAYKAVREKYELRSPNFKNDELKALVWYEKRLRRNEDTALREKKRKNVIKQVKRLDKLLRSPSKGAPSAGVNKYGQDYVHLTNIPENLKRTVIDFCSVFIENDAGVFSGVTKRDDVSQREKRIEAMQRQYAALKKSESYLKESVNDEMAEKLDTVSKIMAERKLSQLTVSELETVTEIIDHLITVINNQVEMWVGGKKEKVEKIGSRAIKELTDKGQKVHVDSKALDFIKKWGVNNMKPIYFFERVGGALETLYLEIQNKGQMDYARNISSAARFMDEVGEKFEYKKWADEEPLVLKTTQGDNLKLTKSQAMHIWATAKREAVAGKDSRHIMQGGIVFENEIEADVAQSKDSADDSKRKLTSKVWKYKKSDGAAHRISLNDLDKISEYLTDEQKKFVDTMVDYLSNDMAMLGNEISMELYGIKRFNERYYIPFNSAKNFIYRSMGEQGEAMLRNESFTKETSYGANKPLVVGDFMEVVAGHIERMAMYNSMVLPLENFSKIWNYKTLAPQDSESESTVSVRSAMETAYGKDYVSYVDTLLKDINGGVNADSREKSVGRLLSNFKKTAVLGSASVVIQQPSAIVRAFAEIDPSFFMATTFSGRKKAWEKALKYSSTALLKDIGGFDTVSGRGTVDWLTKTEYEGKDRVLKFFTDSQYRDDVLAWGPSFADAVTWAHIWLACERETASKNKDLSGEALYKKTGERFDEVINKTQVYDSVLTRSAHMRSKSNTMQVITSFMAEPTTQANMLASAVFNSKNGNRKKASRQLASVVASQLFNAVLVSIIYASRDDDEEKTAVEKYISQVVENFLGSLNPLTMIPLFKDIVSLLQGYDVERNDMSVYADIIDSLKGLNSDKKTKVQKLTDVIGSIGNALGLPLKNLLRDAKAFTNALSGVGNISDTTGKGIFYAIEESSFPILQNFGVWKPTTKQEKLYSAFAEGDKKMYNRIAAQYTSGGKIKSDLKNQIGERFLAGDINEETAIEQLEKLGLSENEAYYELRSLKEPLSEEAKEDSNVDFFDFDLMQSFQSKAEADRLKASSNGKGYSEKGDYSWLENALASADKTAIQKEINDLEGRGVSRSNINSRIKAWLKENDSSVSSAAQRYMKGDFTDFERAVSSLPSKYGVDESTVADAIRSAAGVNSKAIDGTIYAYGDLHTVISNNNSTQTKKITNEIIKAKTQQYIQQGESNQKAKQKAESSVKSSLKSHWKEEYIKADSVRKGNIRIQLKETGLWTAGEILEMTREWDKAQR